MKRPVIFLLAVASLMAPHLMLYEPVRARGLYTGGRVEITSGDCEKKISDSPSSINLFLAGDVMTGRGIDQVLPYPSNPVLYEPYIKNARGYVQIAEQANGPIRRPVGFTYIWGDALKELERAAADVRIINLETSITESEDHWPGKSIHYRMHPANIACLKVARIDFCSLANNHILDWGYAGLEETLVTLRKAEIKSGGVGRNLEEAEAPVVIKIPGKGRVLIFSYGSPTSGIPPIWAALPNRPGVSLLEDFSHKTVLRIKEKVQRVKQRGDIAVASIHWGSNWGYEVPSWQIGFAHELIDHGCIDVIHGHSSHHVRPFEVYRKKLILYGCGDFINDYEGIGGYEGFRDDLALMYFATINSSTGNLVSLRMIPMQIKNFRLNRPSREDVLWLRDTLNREGKPFGTRVISHRDNSLTLHSERGM